MESGSENGQNPHGRTTGGTPGEAREEVPFFVKWWVIILFVILGDIFSCIILHFSGFISLDSDSYYKTLWNFLSVLAFLAVFIVFPVVGYRAARKRMKERKKYAKKSYLQEYMKEQEERKRNTL